jgi:hypothetical protein
MDKRHPEQGENTATQDSESMDFKKFLFFENEHVRHWPNGHAGN